MVTYLRLQTHPAVETDPAMLFLGDDPLSKKKEGLNFVLDSFTREVPGQNVRVGDRHVPLLSLTAEKQTIWRLYKEQFGANALGRTSFKYYCFLPQMRTLKLRTCLCTHCESGKQACESGKQACERLEVLLTDEMVDTVVSAQLNAVKECAANLQYALLQYEHAVTQRVEEDPLDNSLRGNLTRSDLLEIKVAGLDDILPACETASSDPAACEWLAKVRSCVAEIKSYERHLCGKAVQNTRQKQMQSALRDAYDRGEFIVAIVIDYKEKLPSTHKRDEVQGDYWLSRCWATASCGSTALIFRHASLTFCQRIPTKTPCGLPTGCAT